MTNKVKIAVFNRVSLDIRPPVESTPKTPINDEKMPVFPMGAGEEMGLDGIGGARMALTVAGGYGGLLVSRGSFVDRVTKGEAVV